MVLRVDVNADGSVPNRFVPPRTGPPRGGSLHRSVTVPFDSYWACVKLLTKHADAQARVRYLGIIIQK